MNATNAPICYTCQTSLGFSPADRTSLIIMVVLTGVALISCYIGVLWFAIRSREKAKKDSIDENMHRNEAFNNNEDPEDYPHGSPESRSSTASLIPTQKATGGAGKRIP